MNVAQVLEERSAPAPSGCRLWTRGRDWDGYGIVRIDGRSRRAHRIAYELRYGAIPRGQVVRHTCDVPSCVNPEHLIVGTVAENNRDRQDRGRSSDRRGELCPTAKLTWPDVTQIRAALAAGQTHQSLATRYGVSRKAISKIAHGVTWRE